MKRISLTILLTAVLTSCAWNEYEPPSNVMLPNQQTKGDSTTVNADSAYTRHATVMSEYDNAKHATDSTSCNLQIFGRLIIDGGYSANITDTYVTVEKIIIKAWMDNDTVPVIYCPIINELVAEPTELLSWNDMPLGVKYERIRLCQQPLKYRYSFYAQVAVCYILRVRDCNLADGCVTDKYWKEVSYLSDGQVCAMANVLVPLELTSIKFDAVVETSD